MNKGYSRLIEDNLNEEATQVSNIDAGKVSVFGSDAGNKFKEDDWYKQLFELNDMEEPTIQDQYKVEYSVVENTGGGTLVEYGKLANGLYYGLNEETLVIYNDDYHQAYLNQDEEDLYQWQEDHIINAFDPDDTEYTIVANQSKEFKPEITLENEE